MGNTILSALSHSIIFLVAILPIDQPSFHRNDCCKIYVSAFTIESATRLHLSTSIIRPTASNNKDAFSPRFLKAVSNLRFERTDTRVRSSSQDNTAHTERETVAIDAVKDTRRRFLTSSLLSLPTTAAILPLFVPAPSKADDEDLTARYYNEDGSIKGNVDLEAKSRTVSVSFPTTTISETQTSALTSIDGAIVPTGATNGAGSTALQASYQTPQKWTPAPEYLDTSTDSTLRQKACDRIVIYQLPERYDDFRILEKATTTGVTKALGIDKVPNNSEVFPPNLFAADLMGGKKMIKDDGLDGSTETRQYYNFDIAVTPKTCEGGEAENLGLGFCPYDTIVLLSATIVEGKMMVCSVACTRDEWKTSSADLKRVRDSFFVGVTEVAA